MTPAGIKPATFRLVSQHLNQVVATSYPNNLLPLLLNFLKSKWINKWWPVRNLTTNLYYTKMWYNKVNFAGTVSCETKCISDPEDMKW